VNNAVTNPRSRSGPCTTGPTKFALSRAAAKYSLNNTGNRLSTRIQAIVASAKPINNTEKKQPRTKYELKFDIEFASLRKLRFGFRITIQAVHPKHKTYTIVCMLVLGVKAVLVAGTL
jgi:hypothetical protein